MKQAIQIKSHTNIRTMINTGPYQASNTDMRSNYINYEEQARMTDDQLPNTTQII